MAQVFSTPGWRTLVYQNLFLPSHTERAKIRCHSAAALLKLLLTSLYTTRQTPCALRCVARRSGRNTNDHHAVKHKIALSFQRLELSLTRDGYSNLRVIDGKVCGLHVYLMTVGLVVGLNENGYERRYCYEHAQDACRALLSWDGRGHPSGPWIKCKGSCGDLLNPALTG